VVAGWRAIGRWIDIAKKHRFDKAEFYDLVRVLDKKVKSKIECFTTDTKTVDDGSKEEMAELRKCYDAQWEGSDTYLEELKRRRRRPLRTLQKFEAFEEEDKGPGWAL